MSERFDSEPNEDSLEFLYKDRADAFEYPEDSSYELPDSDLSRRLELSTLLSTMALTTPLYRSGFGRLSTFRRQRSFNNLYKGFDTFDEDIEQVQEETLIVDPLPERQTSEKLQDYICRAITPANRDAFEADLQPAQDTLRELYADDPKAVNAINQEADILRWRFFGQPNEPLPAGLYVPRTTKEVELAQHVFNEELEAAVATHSTETARFLRGNKDEIRDIVAEAMRETPLYAYMESFAAPSTQRCVEELPLDQNQQARRTAEITLALTRQYGTTAEELYRPTSGATYNAHRHYVRAIAALDHEIEPQVRLEQSDPDEDPYDRLLRAVQHDIAKQWSEEHGRHATADDVVISFRERSVCGLTIYLDRYLDAIVKRFSDTSDVPEDIVSGSLLHRMVGTAQFEHRTPYLQALEETVMAHANQQLHDLFEEGWSAPSRLKRQSWIRRPLLPEPAGYLGGYTPRDRESQAPVKMQTLANQLRTSAGEVLHDNRQDDTPRLIMEVPLPGGFTPSDEQPDLTIAVLSVQPGNTLYVPGFTTSDVRQEAGRTICNFIKNETDDPYEACAVAIPNEVLDDVAAVYAKQGFNDLAYQIRSSHDMTVEGLTAILSQGMTYTIDPQTDKSVASIGGQPSVQCVGADELLRQGLNAAFGNCTRGVGGYILGPRASSDIAALQHRQTLFIHDGRRYILDATPDLENSLERIREHKTNTTDKVQRYTVEVPRYHSMSYERTVETVAPPSASEAARTILENAPAAIENIRESFEASVRARLGIVDDPRFARREDFYSHVLAISPKPEDPLRSTFVSMFDVVRAAQPQLDTVEFNQQTLKLTQQLIGSIQELPLKDRSRYGDIVDDAMLATLNANVRRLASHLDRMRWALKTLDQ